MAYNSQRFFACFFLLMSLTPVLMSADAEAKRHREASADVVLEDGVGLRRPSLLQLRAELVGQISMKLADFHMINLNKIASAALTMPEQVDVEFGLDQVKNCLAMLGVDFDITKDYKLSFDLPIDDLKNLSDVPQWILPADGRFQLAPLPNQMADYLNQHLGYKKAKINAPLGPKKLKAYAISHSLSIEAGFAAFQTAVVRNIEGMAPILVYFPADYENKSLRFYIVVGFQKNPDGLLQSIAVLDSVGLPAERIQIFSASSFFNKMEASMAKKQANDLMSVLENKKNKKAGALIAGQRSSLNEVKLLGSRSYISFVKPPEDIAARIKIRLPSFF